MVHLLEQIQGMHFPVSLPDSLLAVKQRFDAPCVPDLAAATALAMKDGPLLARIKPNDSVAVGVGSRGIAGLPIIVRTVIEQLRTTGARPFIVPAMGSHGGATAEGQIGVLAELGITADGVGAEIRATMEVQEIGSLSGGPKLFQDVTSCRADRTLLVNRVKPHTDFHGDLESGLAKMAVIGLGKQRGAVAMHALGAAGFQRFLAPAARIYQEQTNLIGGLAILENAYHETAEIRMLTSDEIGGPQEMQLQERARALMARLPFPAIDVLVLRHIGKNVSGTGMDTNVVGRLMIPRQPEDFGGPDIAVISFLDLTEETGGNAAGMGLANVTTARVVKKIDWTSTYTNAITTGIFGMQRVSLPIVTADDRSALQIAMRGCGVEPEDASLVLIQDTLALETIWVSPNLSAVVEDHPQLSIVGEVPLRFNDCGQMLSPWDLA